MIQSSLFFIVLFERGRLIRGAWGYFTMLVSSCICIHIHIHTHTPHTPHPHTHSLTLGNKLSNLWSLQTILSGSFLLVLEAPPALQLSCVLPTPLFLTKSWISITAPRAPELQWPTSARTQTLRSKKERRGRLATQLVASIFLAHQCFSFSQVTSCR